MGQSSIPDVLRSLLGVVTEDDQRVSESTGVAVSAHGDHIVAITPHAPRSPEPGWYDDVVKDAKKKVQEFLEPLPGRLSRFVNGTVQQARHRVDSQLSAWLQPSAPARAPTRAPSLPPPSQPKRSAPAAVVVSEPALPKGTDPNITFRAPRRALPVSKDISLMNVEQGILGDCTFIAVIASLAYSRPEWLRSAVRNVAPHIYEVRLYDRGRETWVRVTDDLPSGGTRPLYGHTTTGDGLYVDLIEKACAKLSGGYGKLEGRLLKPAMQMLTGTTSHTFVLGLYADATIMRIIERAARSRTPMTAGVFAAEQARKTNEQISIGHAFVVLGTLRTADGDFVVVANRNGSGEEYRNGAYDTDVGSFPGTPIRNSTSSDDGIFRIRVGDFRRVFLGLEVAGAERQARIAPDGKQIVHQRPD